MSRAHDPGAASRVLWLTLLLPLAAAVLGAAAFLGLERRRAAAAEDVAAADRAAAAFRAARAAPAKSAEGATDTAATTSPTAVDAVPPPTGWLDDLAAAGYHAALYLDGTRVRAIPAGFAPEAPPEGLIAELERRDGAYAFRLPDGRPAAAAPIKDRDEWDVVGAVLVARAERAPPRLPPAALGLGALAWLVTLPLARAYRASAGVIRTAALFLPAAAFALWATQSVAAAGGRAAVPLTIFGAWTVLAAIGLSLARIAATPLRLRRAAAAWTFLAPSFVHLLVFSVGPILFSAWLSFHEWNLIEPARPFVGLQNYRELAADAAFWNAVRNTAVYVLFVPAGMALGLALALLVHRERPGVRWLRAAFFLPYVTSFVAISLVWKWMFEPDFGILNQVLGALGLPGSPWLTSPRTALPSLMLMSIWMYAGYMMVLFLAGLQAIPASLHEAARIDGANAWQRFRHITLPLLKPTTLFVLVTMVIFMFQVFTAVYVMTEGGPLHATDVLVYHIYRNAWEYLRMGYASAMAWVLFAIVFIATLVQLRWLGGRTHEG